jgi:hypothetical protein
VDDPTLSRPPGPSSVEAWARRERAAIRALAVIAGAVLVVVGLVYVCLVAVVTAINLL